jgi:hypothetical protein
MKKHVDYFDNYFKIIRSFLHYIWSFIKRGANFYAGNSALHRCIPWLHNFWLVITLSIWLNLNIEEHFMSILLLIPWIIIWTIKYDTFFTKYALLLCFYNFLKKWLFLNYFNKKSTKYQLFWMRNQLK